MTRQLLQLSCSTISRHKPTLKRRSHGPFHFVLILSTFSDTIWPAMRAARCSPAVGAGDLKLVTVACKTGTGNIRSIPTVFERIWSFRLWRHHDLMASSPGVVGTGGGQQWSAGAFSYRVQSFPGVNQPWSGVLMDLSTLFSSFPLFRMLFSRPWGRPVAAQLWVPATWSLSRWLAGPVQAVFGRFRPFSSNSGVFDCGVVVTPWRRRRAWSGLGVACGDQPTPPTNNHRVQPFPDMDRPWSGVLVDLSTLFSSFPLFQMLSSRPWERPVAAQLWVPATWSLSQWLAGPMRAVFGRFRPFLSEFEIFDCDGVVASWRRRRAWSGLGVASGGRPTPPAIMFN